MANKIDISKKYQTADGRDVVCIVRVPRNSAGQLVTYPIKGSIINKGRKAPTYQIWSDHGIADVVFGRFEETNLVEVVK